MMEFDRVVREFIQIFKSSYGTDTRPLDTQAQVLRVENGVAWVHIPGGVEETPVKLTVNAEAGDTVQVRIGGGRAWITGNATNPPTDDKTAIKSGKIAQIAQKKASTAKEIADGADSKAKDALKLAEGINEHFWHNNTGAHITQVTQEEYENDPENSGGNLLMTSEGMAIRDGEHELTTATKDGFDSKTYDTNGNEVQIVHLGYGDATAESGTAKAPYYTLGERGDTASEYSPSHRPYMLGELARYNGKLYVCIVDQETNDGWDYSEWQLAIGSRSTAEGDSVTASGANSHAQGYASKAIGYSSSASGVLAVALGNRSHAEGWEAEARGYASHAEGVRTVARYYASHAEGLDTLADGYVSHVSGEGTVADQSHQTAIGKFNTKNNTNNLFVVGNGTSKNARSDAFQVDKYGNVDATGGYTVGGNPLFKVRKVTSVDNQTIAASATNSYYDQKVALTTDTNYTGYTPIGVIDYLIENATTSGAGCSWCHAYKCGLVNENSTYKVHWGVRNMGSIQVKIKLTARILYAATGIL